MGGSIIQRYKRLDNSQPDQVFEEYFHQQLFFWQQTRRLLEGIQVCFNAILKMMVLCIYLCQP